MKKLCITFFISILLTAVFTGCAGTPENEVDISNFETPFIPDSSTENIKRISPNGLLFNTKEKLIGGDFYEFYAEPNNFNYLNIAFANGNKWLSYVINKNEEGYFQKVIQVPADAVIVLISFHNKAYWVTGDNELSVVRSPDKFPVLVKNEEENILFFQAPMIRCNLKLETGKFYKIKISPLIHSNVSVTGEKKKPGKNGYFYWDSQEINKQGYTTFETYFPQTKGTLHFHGRNAENEWEINLGLIELIPSKNPYKFTTTSDYDSLKKYKTRTPDERIIDYMASIDARELGKQDPDLMISQTVDKINELKKDEYEKVKLVHDAVWYLVSYDSDSLALGRELPQDYKSVLKRGMSVCAGFAAVFSQFCQVAQIKNISINGYARGIGFLNQSWDPSDDPTQSNHAWNMVKIENYWYLIDSTWDSGHTRNGKRDNYYSNKYIFVKPEEIIYTHFPSYDSDFQLLDKPYSPKEFSKLPYREPNSF